MSPADRVSRPLLGETMPVLIAAARTWSTSMPAPSSETRISTWRLSLALKASMIVPRGGLFRRARSSGFSYAVVNAIPHEVDERVFQFLQNPLVNLDLRAANDQFHFFALVARQIADQLGENLHEGRHRKHQNLFHRLQVIVHHPPDGALILFRRLGSRQPPGFGARSNAPRSIPETRSIAAARHRGLPIFPLR